MWYAILSQIYNSRIFIFAVIIMLIIIMLNQPILVIPAVLVMIYLEGSITEINKRITGVEERLKRLEKEGSSS